MTGKIPAILQGYNHFRDLTAYYQQSLENLSGKYFIFTIT